MESWMKEENPVMIATSAFGMGIDKSNVKTVLHVNLPENLESYYQEAGRAGRNGEKAFAILVTSSSDSIQAESQFISVLPDVIFLKEMYVKLCNYFQIAYGEGIHQEFSFNLNQFCSQYKLPVLKAYNALQFLDRQGIVSLSNEQSEKVQLKFKTESKEVIRYLSLNQEEEPILGLILRNYSGVFDMQTNINLTFVAKNAQVTEDRVVELLEKLKKLEMIDLFLAKNESKLTFLEVREDDRTINRVAKYLEKQNLNKKNQLASVLTYVSDELLCKNKLLLNYFGENIKEECGVCSFCLNQNKEKLDLNTLRANVLEILKKESKTSRELVLDLNANEKDIILVLKQLLEHNLIIINTKNQFTLI